MQFSSHSNHTVPSRLHIVISCVCVMYKSNNGFLLTDTICGVIEHDLPFQITLAAFTWQHLMRGRVFLLDKIDKDN